MCRRSLSSLRRRALGRSTTDIAYSRSRSLSGGSGSCGLCGRRNEGCGGSLILASFLNTGASAVDRTFLEESGSGSRLGGEAHKICGAGDLRVVGVGVRPSVGTVTCALDGGDGEQNECGGYQGKSVDHGERAKRGRVRSVQKNGGGQGEINEATGASYL